MIPFCPSPSTFSPFLGNHPAPLGSWLSSPSLWVPPPSFLCNCWDMTLREAGPMPPPRGKTGERFIVTEWNQRIIGCGMRVLLGGGAVWALTWEPQQCCLLRTSHLGGRVCTLALRWSTVALKWQAAGSLSPLQRRNPTAAIFKGCSELGGGILWKPGSHTLSGVTPVATDGDTGAQRRQQQVAIVTWMVPTGDWSTQELKCKEAGRTS